MITKEQKMRLKILAREVGFTARIQWNEINIEDDHGGYTFSNDEDDYWSIITMLQKLKASQNVVAK